MTDTEELRAILAKATPGEWKEGNGDFYVDGPDGDDLVIGCVGQAGNFRSAAYSVARGNHHPVRENNAAIVALHNGAPAMLDEIDALRAENARLRDALAGVTDDEPCQYDHHGYCQTHFITAHTAAAVAAERERIVEITTRAGEDGTPHICPLSLRNPKLRDIAIEVALAFGDRLQAGGGRHAVRCEQFRFGFYIGIAVRLTSGQQCGVTYPSGTPIGNAIEALSQKQD
jgi:hypothetical protein